MDGLVVLFILVMVVGVWLGRIHATRPDHTNQHPTAEERRLEECGQVVLFFSNHLGYIAKSCISREELEQLIDQGVEADDLAREIVRRIEAQEGLLLGWQSFGGRRYEVKLPDSYRSRHLYVVGRSGSGKTNLLRTLIYQDLWAGRGLAVLAPEQEMITEELLPYIPPERAGDVMYFNPADTDRPVVFNPLHLADGEDLDLKADQIFTILGRTIEDTGPRMAEILRQSVYALLQYPSATLADVPRLLDRNSDAFRKKVLEQLKDADTRHFFESTYPRFPTDAHLPIVNRLGRFLKPKYVRNSLCGAGESVDFRRAMDTGKILLFNLSDGLLGEASSQLLGQLIAAQLQLAVMSRADTPKADRRPFYLYLDEFQSFVGTSATSYERLLSRARKYNVGLILAHQQTAQVPPHLLKEIFGNVSTLVAFSVSREDAQRLSRELLGRYDFEIFNVPPEELLQLRVGEAYCRIGRHSLKLHTFLADDVEPAVLPAAILEASRKNYGARTRLGNGAGRAARDAELEKLLSIAPERVF